MQTLPQLNIDQRLIVAGRTGSGKTTLANWLALNRSSNNWIVFNPKLTRGYNGNVVKGFNLRKIDKNIESNKITLINFSERECGQQFMDDCILELHNRYENIGIIADELYTLHNSGRVGAGLTAWLTRGRERGQSFIGLTQRPAWISLFCFSEADYIVGMSLTRDADRKTMIANTGRDEFSQRLDNRNWLCYNVAQDSLALWGAVPT